MTKYLTGLQWDLFEGIPDVYATAHHIKSQGWRYFATYSHGNQVKPLIFQKLASQKVNEVRGEWSWHHVVEGNHLAPLFSSSNYDQLYHKEWPTVLIHTGTEHNILNSLFRTKETLAGFPATGAAPLTGKTKDAYIDLLYKRYQEMYTGDFVFQKVAHNVIRGMF